MNIVKLNENANLEYYQSNYCGYIEKIDSGYSIILPFYDDERNNFIELSIVVDSLENLSKSWYKISIMYYNLDGKFNWYFSSDDNNKTLKDYARQAKIDLNLNFNLGKAMVHKNYYLSIMSNFLECEMIHSVGNMSFDLDDNSDRYSKVVEYEYKKDSFNFLYRVIINNKPEIVDGELFYKFIVERYDYNKIYHFYDVDGLLKNRRNVIRLSDNFIYSNFDLNRLCNDEKYKLKFFNILINKLNSRSFSNEKSSYIILNKVQYSFNKMLSFFRINEEISNANNQQDEIDIRKYSLVCEENNNEIERPKIIYFNGYGIKNG